jgi:hypothetical protein
MKRNLTILSLLVAGAFLFSLTSCSPETGNDGTTSDSTTTDDDSSTSTDTTTDYDENTSSRDISADTDDEVANTTFANTIYLNLGTPSYSTDNSTFTTLTSSNQTITDGIKIKASSGYITIDASSSTGATVFNMTGTLSTGTVAIKSNASYAVELYLNGVSITSGNYPCIEVTKASRTFLVLNGTNTLTDGRTYGTPYGTGTYTNDSTDTTHTYVAATVQDGEDTKGTLYTKGQLLISGTGSLSVTSAYKHCIYSKDYIRMFGGTITTHDSGRNGIQSVNGFIMEDGTISITGTGTYANNESRGIIVEGEESDTNMGEGFILINGGTITINTVSKGMSAKWDVDEDYDGYDDGETNDTSDDPYPYVKITGGTISVTTTGTPFENTATTVFTDADGVSTTEALKLSPEGIEGKQSVFITGGSLTINTTDDCINASHSGDAAFVISGGTIYAYSSANDALDSNGTLTISGGTIVALTKTTPECAFDCDNYTFTITGGTFVGIGTSNYSAPTTSACTQNAIVLGSSYYTAGSTMALKSSSATAFAFDIPSGYGSSGMIMVLSSPNIASSTTYTIYNGATVTGADSTFHGLYLGSSLSASGGTAVSTNLTTSTTVTTLSTSTNGGAQEGTPGTRP